MNYIDHENEISELIWAIEASAGQFSLILAHCNYSGLRKNIAEQLHEKIKIISVAFPKDKKSLLKEISAGIKNNPDKTPVMVCGLESAYYPDDIMKSGNNDREDFSRNFSFPLILWVNENLFSKIMKNAPDFENWSTSVHFTPSDKEILDMLNHAVFFPASEKSDPEETELFLKDIEKRQMNLTPELQANLQFLYGKNAENKGETDKAIQFYGECQISALAKFHIAKCYKKRKELENAKSYFQECLKLSENQDLSVKCMCELGEVLEDLKQWDELEKLSENALQIGKSCGYSNECIQCYRLLAEVAVWRNDWKKAEDWTQNILNTLYPDKKPVLRNAEQVLEFLKEKSKSLEYNEAELFIKILDLLRRLYFQIRYYLESFQIKQEKYSFEQQFGLRAFIGAGRLKARRFIAGEINIAEEIEASGRKEDIGKIIDKITSGCKVLVFHGQSGVGKSSILEAGLEPALKHKSLRDYDEIKPVLIRSYTDWVKEISEKISDKPLLKEELIARLKEFNEKKYLTVLIFDQFEEFFFAHPDSAKRCEFYDFLEKSVNIPVVRLIFSLREDYLHYLLEMERIIRLEIFIDEKQGILSREFRYSLGNFSKEGARDVIKSLTRRSQFILDDALIDRIVEDLAKDSGGVRPIELQIVGSRVQADNINSLEKYRPKEELIEEFVNESVADCGKENEKIAQLVLYLLTDEKNTRPLKTKQEIVNDLKNLMPAVKNEQTDLVLTVLRGSGLIFLVPGEPEKYQLVHDYLVEFIRKGQTRDLLAELESERIMRIKAEKKQRLYFRLAFAALSAVVVLAVWFGVSEKINARKIEELIKINKVETLSYSSYAFFLSGGKDLEALIAAVKAGKKAKQFNLPVILQQRMLSIFHEVFHGVCEKIKLEGHTDPVSSIAFSPDGKILASGSRDKTIKLWDVAEIKQLALLSGYTDSVFYSVAFSPDGKIFASGSADNTITLWDIAEKKQIAELTGHTYSVYSVAFSPDGKLLALSERVFRNTSNTGITGIILCNITEKCNITEEEITELKGHTESVNSVAFSPDGRILASGSRDKTIRLWNVEEGKQIVELVELKGHTDSVSSVAFSPDGKILASGSRDKTIILWDVEKKEKIEPTLGRAY